MLGLAPVGGTQGEVPEREPVNGQQERQPRREAGPECGGGVEGERSGITCHEERCEAAGQVPAQQEGKAHGVSPTLQARGLVLGSPRGTVMTCQPEHLGRCLSAASRVAVSPASTSMMTSRRRAG